MRAFMRLNLLLLTITATALTATSPANAFPLTREGTIPLTFPSEGSPFASHATGGNDFLYIGFSNSNSLSKINVTSFTQVSNSKLPATLTSPRNMQIDTNIDSSNGDNNNDKNYTGYVVGSHGILRFYTGGLTGGLTLDPTVLRPTSGLQCDSYALACDFFPATVVAPLAHKSCYFNAERSSGSVPDLLIHVDLATFSVVEEVALESGETNARGAVIVRDYLYLTGGSLSSTSPTSFLIKFSLMNYDTQPFPTPQLKRIASIAEAELAANPHSIVSDYGDNLFLTLDRSGASKVIRVSLNIFQVTSSVTVPSSDIARSVACDPATRSLYAVGVFNPATINHFEYLYPSGAVQFKERLSLSSGNGERGVLSFAQIVGTRFFAAGYGSTAWVARFAGVTARPVDPAFRVYDERYQQQIMQQPLQPLDLVIPQQNPLAPRFNPYEPCRLVVQNLNKMRLLNFESNVSAFCDIFIDNVSAASVTFQHDAGNNWGRRSRLFINSCNLTSPNATAHGLAFIPRGVGNGIDDSNYQPELISINNSTLGWTSLRVPASLSSTLSRTHDDDCPGHVDLAQNRSNAIENGTASIMTAEEVRFMQTHQRRNPAHIGFLVTVTNSQITATASSTVGIQFLLNSTRLAVKECSAVYIVNCSFTAKLAVASTNQSTVLHSSIFFGPGVGSLTVLRVSGIFNSRIDIELPPPSSSTNNNEMSTFFVNLVSVSGVSPLRPLGFFDVDNIRNLVIAPTAHSFDQAKPLALAGNFTAILGTRTTLFAVVVSFMSDDVNNINSSSSAAGTSIRGTKRISLSDCDTIHVVGTHVGGGLWFNSVAQTNRDEIIWGNISEVYVVRNTDLQLFASGESSFVRLLSLVNTTRAIFADNQEESMRGADSSSLSFVELSNCALLSVINNTMHFTTLRSASTLSRLFGIHVQRAVASHTNRSSNNNGALIISHNNYTFNGSAVSWSGVFACGCTSSSSAASLSSFASFNRGWVIENNTMRLDDHNGNIGRDGRSGHFMFMVLLTDDLRLSVNDSIAMRGNSMVVVSNQYAVSIAAVLLTYRLMTLRLHEGLQFEQNQLHFFGETTRMISGVLFYATAVAESEVHLQTAVTGIHGRRWNLSCNNVTAQSQRKDSTINFYLNSEYGFGVIAFAGVAPAPIQLHISDNNLRCGVAIDGYLGAFGKQQCAIFGSRQLAPPSSDAAAAALSSAGSSITITRNTLETSAQIQGNTALLAISSGALVLAAFRIAVTHNRLASLYPPTATRYLLAIEPSHSSNMTVKLTTVAYNSVDDTTFFGDSTPGSVIPFVSVSAFSVTFQVLGEVIVEDNRYAGYGQAQLVAISSDATLRRLVFRRNVLRIYANWSLFPRYGGSMMAIDLTQRYVTLGDNNTAVCLEVIDNVLDNMFIGNIDAQHIWSEIRIINNTLSFHSRPAENHRRMGSQNQNILDVGYLYAGRRPPIAMRRFELEHNTITIANNSYLRGEYLSLVKFRSGVMSANTSDTNDGFFIRHNVIRVAHGGEIDNETPSARAFHVVRLDAYTAITSVNYPLVVEHNVVTNLRIAEFASLFYSETGLYSATRTTLGYSSPILVRNNSVSFTLVSTDVAVPKQLKQNAWFVPTIFLAMFGTAFAEPNQVTGEPNPLVVATVEHNNLTLVADRRNEQDKMSRRAALTAWCVSCVPTMFQSYGNGDPTSSVFAAPGFVADPPPPLRKQQLRNVLVNNVIESRVSAGGGNVQVSLMMPAPSSSSRTTYSNASLFTTVAGNKFIVPTNTASVLISAEPLARGPIFSRTESSLSLNAPGASGCNFIVSQNDDPSATRRRIKSHDISPYWPAAYFEAGDCTSFSVSPDNTASSSQSQSAASHSATSETVSQPRTESRSRNSPSESETSTASFQRTVSKSRRSKSISESDATVSHEATVSPSFGTETRTNYSRTRSLPRTVSQQTASDSDATQSSPSDSVSAGNVSESCSAGSATVTRTSSASESRSKNTVSFSKSLSVPLPFPVLGLDAATQEALSTSTGAATIAMSILAGGVPTLALSMGRALSLQQLIGCPQKAADGWSLLHQQVSFPFSLLPGVRMGSQPGAYYRSAVVSFVLLAVAAVFLGFVWTAVVGVTGDSSGNANNARSAFKPWLKVPQMCIVLLGPFCGFWSFVAATLLGANGASTSAATDIVISVVPLVMAVAGFAWCFQQVYSAVVAHKYTTQPSFIFVAAEQRRHHEMRRGGGAIVAEEDEEDESTRAATTTTSSTPLSRFALRLLRNNIIGRYLLVGDVTWANRRSDGSDSMKRTSRWSRHRIDNDVDVSDLQQARTISLLAAMPKLFTSMHGQQQLWSALGPGQIVETRRGKWSPCYLAFQIVATILVSLLQGFSVANNNTPKSLCHAALVTSLLVAIVTFSTTLLLLPYILVSRNVVVLLVEFCCLLASMFAVIITFTEQQTEAANTAAAVIQIVIAAVPMLGSCVVGIVVVARPLLLKLAGAEIIPASEYWRRFDAAKNEQELELELLLSPPALAPSSNSSGSLATPSRPRKTTTKVVKRSTKVVSKSIVKKRSNERNDDENEEEEAPIEL